MRIVSVDKEVLERENPTIMNLEESWTSIDQYSNGEADNKVNEDVSDIDIEKLLDDIFGV